MLRLKRNNTVLGRVNSEHDLAWTVAHSEESVVGHSLLVKLAYVDECDNTLACPIFAVSDYCVCSPTALRIKYF